MFSLEKALSKITFTSRNGFFHKCKESRFSTDIPASAPTDNLLLPLRPIMSEIKRKQNLNVLVPVLLYFEAI